MYLEDVIDSKKISLVKYLDTALAIEGVKSGLKTKVFPSLSKALIGTKGKLTPITLIKLLKAIKITLF